MPDHLGLVAGIIDEIGIVEKINELIDIDFSPVVHTRGFLSSPKTNS